MPGVEGLGGGKGYGEAFGGRLGEFAEFLCRATRELVMIRAAGVIVGFTWWKEEK